LRASLLRTLPVAAVGLGIGVLFAGQVLSGVFGTDFAEARVPLQILLVAVLLNLVAAQYRNTLIALGRQGRDFTNVLAGTTMHIGLKLFLVPIWGVTGAAFGNLLGEAVFVAFAWQATRKAFRQSDANQEVEPAPSVAETQTANA
jgi:O-antigen/teichoic acid export membrane protein